MRLGTSNCPFIARSIAAHSNNLHDNETAEFGAFAAAVADVEHSYEFVVIDTPASDSYLMRLAHSLADTLVSPVNDFFIDVDVFSRVHHDKSQRGQVAHYADLVLEARRTPQTRRSRPHRLGAGAQPHVDDSIEQCKADRREPLQTLRRTAVPLRPKACTIA